MSNYLSSLVAFSATRETTWQTLQENSLLSSGDNILCDTSAGTFVVQLPSNPLAGASVRLMDPNGAWASNPIQVDPQGQLLLGSHNVANFSVASLTLIFASATLGWVAYNTDTPTGLSVRGATTPAAARTALGLGSISTQAAASVAILGGSIDNTTIGATTPASGVFTSLKAATASLTDSSTNAATTAFVYGLVAGNWQTVTSATTLAVLPANLLVDSSASAFTIALPASPVDGSSVVLVDVKKSWATNNITINPNGQNIGADTTALVLNASGYIVKLLFKTGLGWSVSGNKIS